MEKCEICNGPVEYDSEGNRVCTQIPGKPRGLLKNSRAEKEASERIMREMALEMKAALERFNQGIESLN